MWKWYSCLGHRGSGSTRSSGGWKPGQKEIQYSRRAWKPELANTLQYSCLENPLSDREAWQATVYRVAKSRTGLFLLACGITTSVRVECEGGAAAWLAGTLAVPSVQVHKLPPQQEF